MDHFQLFDFELSVLYNLASRGGRIEMLVNVKGTHVKGVKGRWHWEVVMTGTVMALCAASQLLVLRRHSHHRGVRPTRYCCPRHRMPFN